MKKGKGVKRKSSRDNKAVKKNNLLLFLRENKLLTFLICLLLLFTLFFVVYNLIELTGNSFRIGGGGTGSGDPTVKQTEDIIDFMDQPLPDFGKVIMNFLDGVGPNAFEGASDWKSLIVMLLIYAIFLATIFDLLSLLSFFMTPWVIWVISICLSLIAALTGIIRNTATFLFQIGAGVIIFGVSLEIIMVGVIFIGLIFGNAYLAKLAAKRKGQREEIKTIAGSGSAISAIKALKKLDREFKRVK